MPIYTAIDQLIGKTPLVRLCKMEQSLGLCAQLIAKLEYRNPAGSVKDRVALGMIDEAERAGKGAVSYIAGLAEEKTAIATKPGYGVRYVLPQTIHTTEEDVTVFLRVAQPFGKVKFTVAADDKVLAVAKRLRAAPGEMEKITVKKEMLQGITGPVTVSLEVL